ncbi:hypothetical protein Pcinc_015640 [Petrolisthes cinctipes]|uniref:Sodium-coupled monocarboxylate transporter 1 n=1 Tax=Petrolisthes cinctipes TaxID=88211 RepID=A0AAE1KQ98_PETCI|nr:hypothetical protein Pcinc_015640 [Petrolisthes cinctipes]
MFYLSGLVAYATYKHCDPLTSGRINKADQIIPYLVMDKLGEFPGLPGLFVAAVYGGVLSSMSSQANSIACLVWEDFLKETTFFSKLSPEKAVTVVKVITVLAGMGGIGLALLVGQLGTLFSVAYSISGAITGPLDGLYMAGIFMPWTNKKGAVTGIVTSFVVSLWRVIGNFIRGGGSPPHLPFSTDGCPENYYNYSTITNTTTTTTTIPPNTTTVFPSEEVYSGSHSFYDISYCYNGAMAIIITMVVCGIVSLLTNPLPPDAVDHRLTNPTVARLYRKLWEALASCGLVKVKAKKEEVVEMDDKQEEEGERDGDEYKNKNNTSNNDNNITKIDQEFTEGENHNKSQITSTLSSSPTTVRRTTQPETSPVANTNNIDV